MHNNTGIDFTGYFHTRSHGTVFIHRGRVLGVMDDKGYLQPWVCLPGDTMATIVAEVMDGL